MKHWCPLLQKLTSDPPCEDCQDSLCGTGWYLRTRKKFRGREEIVWSRKKKVSLSRITKYFLSSVFLPGIVMLFWVPFILLVTGYSFNFGLWGIVACSLTCFTLSLGLHEAGHLSAAKLLDVKIEEWKLVPFGVGFKTERADLDRMLKIYSAGPAVNLLLPTVAIFASGSPFFYFLALTSLFLFLMNSLPHRGSDGFQILMRLTDSMELYPYLIVGSMLVSGPLLAVLIVLFI